MSASEILVGCAIMLFVFWFVAYMTRSVNDNRKPIPKKLEPISIEELYRESKVSPAPPHLLEIKESTLDGLEALGIHGEVFFNPTNTKLFFSVPRSMWEKGEFIVILMPWLSSKGWRPTCQTAEGTQLDWRFEFTLSPDWEVSVWDKGRKSLREDLR